jgi:hypothetical protein
MEVTFRTAAAEGALRALQDAAVPGVCIGEAHHELAGQPASHQCLSALTRQ